jgi:excisionase family DNA binding protein
MMTAEEVAAFLRISLTTVYQLARRRELPGVRIGVQWRFNPETVRAFGRGELPAPDGAPVVPIRGPRRRV